MHICYKHIISIVMLLQLTHMTSQAGSLDANFSLATTQTEFTAGNPVILHFIAATTSTPKLYISNSFGSTLITPVRNGNTLSYNIPKPLGTKAGVINWKLLASTLHGHINILPSQNVAIIQSYLGPPSITAGRRDYTMLVNIPTDAFDNPLADGTKVAVKHLFLNKQTIDTVKIKNSINYKNIFSPFKTGRVIVSASCYDFNSKEYDVNIMPAPPTNFNITYNRHHNYADGNQITTFTTSKIKDPYGNIVSDGTYVQFFIKNAEKAVLKTSGTTINGSAVARMIHPNHEDTWSAKAYVVGMAESNTVTLQFKPVITDFNIVLSKSNRHLKIGPLVSFMQQMIPDGLEVKLEVYKENKHIETLRKSSAKGYVNFKLNPNQFPNSTYTFKVHAARITKTLNAIKIW